MQNTLQASGQKKTFKHPRMGTICPPPLATKEIEMLETLKTNAAKLAKQTDRRSAMMLEQTLALISVHVGKKECRKFAKQLKG